MDSYTEFVTRWLYYPFVSITVRKCRHGELGAAAGCKRVARGAGNAHFDFGARIKRFEIFVADRPILTNAVEAATPEGFGLPTPGKWFPRQYCFWEPLIW